MKNDEEIMESLVAEGLIGTAMSSLLSKNNGENASLGTLAGAAILGTFKAGEKAKETSIPMFVVENGDLFQIQKDHDKKFVRKIEKPTIQLRRSFKLK
ncbi:hypothetical protein GCM10009119_11530 [Algoriphagus jejuensis]|uniref:Uncharacterized protein n=1 Tax=Algoriphagus jejuensis TaxID=419934 RepID=A0ABN1MXG3_9BACT